MDVFRFLKEENNRVSERLDDTVKNYSEWTRDRVFEVVKKALQELTNHFETEKIVICNLKDTSQINSLLETMQSQRAAIQEDVANLLMIHVDEVGFEDGLEAIAEKYREYRIFAEEKVYPTIESHLTSADLERASDQVMLRVA